MADFQIKPLQHAQWHLSRGYLVMSPKCNRIEIDIYFGQAEKKCQIDYCINGLF